jgi:hypothetical protein
MTAQPIALNPTPPATGVRTELVLSVVAVLLLGLSPLASFALCAFLLINLPAHTPREARWVLGLATAIALAIMAGSRPIDPDDPSADIFVYHEIYSELAAGDLYWLTHFGGGLELTLPVLMWAWSWLLPPLTVNGLMFCLALTASVSMWLWAETRPGSAPGSATPAMVGICLVLLNIYFATQLARQFLSLIVLLFAFGAATRPRRWFFLALASSLHLTALPFYALWLLARRGWLGWLAILGVMLVLRLYFVPLLAALDIVPQAVADKLQYYVDQEDASADADIGSLRMVGVLGLLSLVSLLACRLRPDPATRPWLVLPWMTGAVHFMLLPIPLASLRTTLIVHSVATGFIVWQMFAHRARGLLPVVLNVLLLYKVAAFAAGEGGAYLRPTAFMLSSFF